MPTPISHLRNLGPSMEHYCREVGVDSAEALKKRGYLDTYIAIKHRHPRHMNRMALYALYGALTNQDCMKLPDAIKEQLTKEVAHAEKNAPKREHDSIPLADLP